MATMDNSSAKTYGYIVAGAYLGLLILVLLLISLKVPIPVRTPPDGIDIVTEIQTLGGGAPRGGGAPEPQQNNSGGTAGENIISSSTGDKTHTTSPNNNSNNDNSSTNWDDMWSNSKNTNSSAPGTNGGNGGDGPGGDGLGGSGNCKGCRGSGTGLGNGDATRLIIPKVNNQDEGVIVVKVKVDKNGKVVEAKEYGQQGTYGNLSETSYREAKNAALQTTFSPEPKTNDYRTGTLTYNFHRN